MLNSEQVKQSIKKLTNQIIESNLNATDPRLERLEIEKCLYTAFNAGQQYKHDKALEYLGQDASPEIIEALKK